MLEFGSDSEDNEELISQLQEIISSGNVPEEADEATKVSEEQIPSDSQQTHAVFIGNLLPSVDKKDLIDLVKDVAEPTQARVLMQNRNGLKVAVAFLDFVKASAVQKVVKKFNGFDFQGKKLQVRPANDRKLEPAASNGVSVHLRNLPFSTSEEALRKIFGRFGEILKIRLPVFKDSGKHRGYGFIDYKESSSAKKALAMDRKEIDGRKIIVELAELREAPKGDIARPAEAGEHLEFDD